MKRLTWPILIGVSSILFILSTGFNIQSPLRVALTFWFMLVCPGMAFIHLLQLKEPIFEWVLAVALSIAIGTIFAEVAVVNQWWSPAVIGILLAGVSVFGAGLQVIFIFRGEKQKQVSHELKPNFDSHQIHPI